METVNFTPSEYKGGIQNWGITTTDGILLCGNNNGVLRFNGSDWSILSNGDNFIVRDVKPAGEKIYAAGDDNLGYWTYDRDGCPAYTSLLPLADSLGIDDKTFWHIVLGDDNIVYFHSFSDILSYDGSVMKRLIANDCYLSLFNAGGDMFTQKLNGGIYSISGSEIIPFLNDPMLAEHQIKFMFKAAPGHYIIGLTDGGIYKTSGNNSLQPLYRLETPHHIPARIECGALYSDHLLAVGTIASGLYLIDLRSGEITTVDSSVLQDSNIHDICFSGKGRIWLSTDNGISAVTFTPEIYSVGNVADIGVFFDAANFDNAVYIATNKGLYRRSETMQRLPVNWFPLSLSVIKGELLCGSTTALYKKQSATAPFVKLCDANGIRQFEYVADYGNEYLFLRGYSGISTLKYDGLTWNFNSTIMGTEDYLSILPESIGVIWVLHAQKGLLRLRVNKDLTAVDASDRFEYIDSCRVKGMFKIDGTTFFISTNGVYTYNIATKQFIRHNTDIPGIAKLQGIHQSANNRLWIATGDELNLYEVDDMDLRLIKRHSLISNPPVLYDRHYNIKEINDSITFVATQAGMIGINNKSTSDGNEGISIENCRYKVHNQTIYAPITDRVIRLPHNATDIALSFTAGIESPSTSFAYKATGLSDDWSEWQRSGIIRFTALQPGSYNINVRDTNGNDTSVRLEIAVPFYRNGWMIALYIALAAAGILLSYRIMMRRKELRMQAQMAQRQKEHEEELQRRQTEYLTEKVKNQEAELQNKLRYLTQKQELISSISDEIESQKKELGDRWPNKLYLRLLKLIQGGASETDKLLSFENYFAEIQNEFMQRIHNAHPNLTRSELRLCCLLRSNLSNKEIAAIMSIEARSVELKKYRLKKHLGLDPNSSLSGYIASV